jgi:hypothetical protein
MIRLYSEKNNSSYVVNDNIGIFVKYSTKRMSPWHFTFMKKHCDELFGMMYDLKEAFLVLICRDNGIVCLNSKEIKTLLDNDFNRPQSLSVSRRPREKYRVTSGRNDKLKYKIADNQFPTKIFKG